MTVQEVADYLRVTRSTIYLWIEMRDGFPRPYQIGRKKLIWREDIKQFRDSKVVE